MTPSQMAIFPIANNIVKKNNNMNQMGPQNPALDMPLIIRHITSYQKYFMTYFTNSNTNDNTKMCFEHGELPFSG